jgi:hypothetical protein
VIRLRVLVAPVASPLIHVLVTLGLGAAVGCGGGKPQVASAGGGARTTGTQTTAGTHGTTGQLDTPAGKVPDVGCLQPSCAYHAGTGGYFSCMAGGAGLCFHYGAPCSPRDGCMFDSIDGLYKQCTSIVEGRCARWGGACVPASGCMYSPADRMHRACAASSGGACQQYGASCAP